MPRTNLIQEEERTPFWDKCYIALGGGCHFFSILLAVIFIMGIGYIIG